MEIEDESKKIACAHQLSSRHLLCCDSTSILSMESEYEAQHLGTKHEAQCERKIQRERKQNRMLNLELNMICDSFL